MNDHTSIMKRVKRFAYTWDFQGPHVNFVLSPHNSDRLSSGDLRYLVSRLSELEATIASQAAQIERLRADLRDWAECASIDVTMKGPRLMGWNPIALNRCLDKYEAALQPEEGEG